MYHRNMAGGTINKIFIFIIFFSLFFSLVKLVGLVPLQSANDASSLGWLYSVAGVIFGVLSGFVIQMKWQIWDRLVEATNGEIASIRQLHSLIHHLPKLQRDEIKVNLKLYLGRMIEAHSEAEMELSNTKIYASLHNLEETIYKLYDDEKVTNIDSIAYELFRKIMDWHEKWVNYQEEHLLPVIRFFILSNAILLSVLSVLLPVANLGLDYIFTLSISLLAYAVYLLIDDLDHPFRHGNWHLSTKGYSDLLKELADS